MEASNVNVAVTGAITKIPSSLVVTSASQPLTGGTPYGFANEDGVEIAGSRSTSNIVAWQRAAVVRRIVTEAEATYTFVLIENTQAVRELYYGTEEVNGVIKWDPAKMASGKFVIDAIDDTDEDKVMYVRHVIHDGVVSEIAPITLANGTPIAYGVTITAQRGGNGVCADIFHGDGVLEPTDPVDPEPEPEPQPEVTMSNIMTYLRNTTDKVYMEGRDVLPELPEVPEDGATISFFYNASDGDDVNWFLGDDRLTITDFSQAAIYIANLDAVDAFDGMIVYNNGWDVYTLNTVIYGVSESY